MTEKPPFASLPGYLPPGRLIEPHPGFAGEDTPVGPVLWVSEEPCADATLWTRLHADHQRTGLLPLLLEPFHADEDRPWLVGEFGPRPLAEIDEIDVEKTLRQWWEPEPEYVAEGEMPDAWPGLAPATPATSDPDAKAAEFAGDLLDFREPRLGLVHAASGADALTAVGWDGPCNHASATEISAVLRSWADRFGARVVCVGFDTLMVTVANPPSTPEHARAVAAEHYAFCPDNIDQADHDFDEYANDLLNRQVWHFWWD